MEKMWQPQPKSVKHFLALILLLINFSFLRDSIAKEVKELADPIFGMDNNDNIVRDDVEDFIKNDLGKKEAALYKAYFNFAETKTLQLKFRFNKKKLIELDDIDTRDMNCILALEKKADPMADIRRLNNKIDDTKIRKETRHQMYAFLEQSILKQYPKEQWLSLCRK